MKIEKRYLQTLNEKHFNIKVPSLFDHRVVKYEIPPIYVCTFDGQLVSWNIEKWPLVYTPIYPVCFCHLCYVRMPQKLSFGYNLVSCLNNTCLFPLFCSFLVTFKVGTLISFKLRVKENKVNLLFCHSNLFFCYHILF